MKTNMSKTGNLFRDFLAAKLPLFIVAGTLLSALTAQAGVWTALNNAPPSGLQMGLLMSDGTVICPDGGTDWYRLTPDIHGSYINGTWTQIASMNYNRLFFSSDVLTNGNVYVAGGEYGGGPAELYNYLANTWTVIQPPTENFSDACSKMLPNGNVLQSDSQSSYYIYNVAQNTETDVGSCEDMNETCWVRMPNDNILGVTGYSTTSEHYVPSLNAWYADNDVPVDVFGYGGELGPAFVLPNGKVFQVGATANTAIYTPGTALTSAGSWVAGPQMVFGPNGLGAVDAPGAAMITGNVLLCIGPTNGYNAPCYFYEYNYVLNNLTQQNAPGGGTTYNNSSPFGTSMLCLPDGNVLFFGGQGTTSLFAYAPGGTPLAAGKPTINSITQNADGSYLLTGIGLNGITGGAAYGDDWQMDTSYPLVRMTNNLSGNVYYARTYNWSSTTIQNPNPVTTDFSLPSGLPPGTYSLVVTVMGNVSSPQTFIYAPPSVPTGLTSQAGDNQILLSWNVVSGATNYAVKQLIPGNPSYYATLATVTGTNYTVANLVNLNSYSYVVSAIGTNGPSANSLSVTVTPVGLPATPTGFSAYADTSGRITLNWSMTGAVNYFNIKRSATHNGPYTNLTTSINPFYTDSRLALGQTYYYVVSAVNPYGESTNSTEASAAPENIANFGFEQPTYTSGEYNYDPTNGVWQFDGASPSGSGMLANGSGFRNANAPEGLKAAFLQSTGIISQTLSGFIPGTNYTLTYLAAQRPGYSQTWNVQIDNTVIQTNNTPGGTSYADYSTTFVATSPVHTLSFVGTDLAGNSDTVFLDDVAIWPAQPSSYGSNLGFESPSLGNGNYQYNPSGGIWAFSGSPGNGSGIVANGSGFGNPNAPEGVQAAFVQELGTISQTLSGLTPGTNYTIIYSAAQRGTGEGGESWNVTIDGTVIATNNPGSSATSYVNYTARFTATSTTHTLAFVGTDLAGGDRTVFIDNVMVGSALQPLSPPAITLSGVTNGALMNYLTTIQLSANVVTNGNSITAVQYFYDATNPMSGQLTTAAYSYSWSPNLAGNHSVFARVYYNNGSQQDSAAAAINFVSVLPATAADVVGSQVSFQAVCNVLVSLSYQWQKIRGGVTNNIAGATNATLTLTNLQLTDTASYQLVTTNANGVAVSSSGALTVSSVPAPVNNVIRAYADQTGLGASFGDFTPTWTLASGNLIAGLAPSSAIGSFSQEWPGRDPNSLTAGGSLTIGTTPNGSTSVNYVTCGSSGGQSLIYTLPASANGYDLTNITIYGGWLNNGRDQQAYTISYATATAPGTFITLGSANYLPSVPSGVQSATRATWTASSGYLATNVAAVKFDFTTPAGENGYEGYSEIGLFGYLTPIAPLIALTAPANNTIFSAANPVNLAAAVTTNGNIIAGVQFYSNTSNLISQVTAPYTYAWSNASAGASTVFARLVFNGTNTIDSSSVNITVTNPPPSTGGIESVNGQTLSISGSGLPNRPYYLNTATNLTPPVAWIQIQTNISDASGNILFTNIAPTNTQQFFLLSAP